MNIFEQFCFRINTTEPDMEMIRPLEETLFDRGLDATSYIMPPMQIDFGCQMKIVKGVFINHSLTCMAAGGITIDGGVIASIRTGDALRLFRSSFGPLFASLTGKTEDN